MYVEVPIVGSGEPLDKQRAGLNVPKSAVIPCDPATGKAKHTTTIVWVDDKFENEVDRSTTRIPIEEAHELIRQLDPKIHTDRLEQKRSRDIHSSRNR